MNTYLQHIVLQVQNTEYNKPMIVLALTLVVAFCLLLVGEYLHRLKYIKGESSRKFVHITFGIYAASWAHFLDKQQLIGLSLLLIVGVMISYYFRIFTAIHHSRIRFLGELLYAAGILVSAVLSLSPWIYTASILCLSLADGMAAVIGKKHAKKKIIYGSKTLGGTLAFFVFSVLSLGIAYYTGGADYMAGYAPILFIWLPVFLSATELIAPWGTDNILVPLVVTYVLNTVFLLQR